MIKRMLCGALVLVAMTTIGYSASPSEIAAAIVQVSQQVNAATTIAVDGMLLAVAATGNIEKVKEWNKQKAEILKMKDGKDKDMKLQELSVMVSSETNAALDAKQTLSDTELKEAQVKLGQARANATIAKLKDLLILPTIPLLVADISNALKGKINPISEAANLKILKYGSTRMTELPKVIQAQIDALDVIKSKTKALADANKITLPDVETLTAETAATPCDM